MFGSLGSGDELLEQFCEPSEGPLPAALPLLHRRLVDSERAPELFLGHAEVKPRSAEPSRNGPAAESWHHAQEFANPAKPLSCGLSAILLPCSEGRDVDLQNQSEDSLADTPVPSKSHEVLAEGAWGP